MSNCNGYVPSGHWVFGANYMYLLRKPPITSLLNIMGGWPWYILAADVLAAVSFFALQWPFRRSGASRPVRSTA